MTTGTNAQQALPTGQSLVVLGALYVAQAVPLGFFIVALPAIARSEGLSLERVGVLGTLAFPYLLKFLWAPLVDRFGWRRFGHYRSWIVPLQLGSVVSVIALAFLEPTRFLSASETSTSTVIWLALCWTAAFMLCSATQDVATDGLAVRLVSSEERGVANGVQVGGYYLGQILGGGLVLVLFARLGWKGALLAMALLLTLPLLPLRGLNEPQPTPVAKATGRPSALSGLGAFFRRSGVVRWVLVLLTYRAGEAMALVMLNPMLVDQGFSLERVGLAVGLLGSLASLSGAMAGGALTQRLGRRRSLVALGLIQAAALITYIVPALTGSWTALLVAVMIASACGGAATAALYTWMMDRCAMHSAATDFSLQQSICAVGPLAAVGLSGISASSLGYANHFVLCAGLALASTAMVALFVTERHAAIVPDTGAGDDPALP